VTVPVAVEGETAAVKTISEPGYAVAGAGESAVVEEFPDDPDEATISLTEFEVLDA
jgi:hypothetical protein